MYHCHTDYSLLDSATKPQEYVDLAVKYGQKALSIAREIIMWKTGKKTTIAEQMRRVSEAVQKETEEEIESGKLNKELLTKEPVFILDRAYTDTDSIPHGESITKH